MNLRKQFWPILLGLVLAAGCAAPPAATGSAPAKPAAGGASTPASGAASAGSRAPLSPPVAVRFAHNATGSNAAVYLALSRGYFRDEGLNVTLELIERPEDIGVAISTGRVEAAVGPVNAGQFNAIARQLPVKMVAGMVLEEPDYTSAALVVRKELVDSGRLRDYADLRGLRIAMPAPTVSFSSDLAKALALGGLSESDVDVKIIPPPDAPAALANNAIDASFMPEPFLARSVQMGIGVPWKRSGEINPRHQVVVMLYSTEFTRRQPEAATRFLTAYLRAAREYTAAMKGQGDPTPIYQVLAEHTPIKDLSIYPALAPVPVQPDGELILESLEADQALWVRQGHIPQPVDISRAVDLQYLEAARRQLDAR